MKVKRESNERSVVRKEREKEMIENREGKQWENMKRGSGERK